MSRVLLTGATGFIGQHALTSLIDAGHEVHAVARTSGSRAGVVWHSADLLHDQSVVSRVRPRALVHLAWFAEHGAFWTAPENVRWLESSLAMLRAFVAAGGERAVLAGSCAEYEWSRDIYPEDAAQRPATLYGGTKHALHVAASAYAEQVGFALAWGRLFFVYGPHEAPGRFVAALASHLLAGESAPMTAGTQVRDFLHAADAGAAFAALVDSTVTGPLNIASGNGVALRDLAALIAECAGASERLQVGALPMREGEPRSLVADVRRLRNEVGFNPRVALPDGIAATVDWWRKRLARAGTAP